MDLLLLTFCFTSFLIVTETKFYPSHEYLTALDARNFEKEVFNSPYGWIVQYYSTKSEHSKKFARIWKKFAKNIDEWQDVVKVAVVNCADEINQELCKDIKNTPTIKYFYANSTKEDDKGHFIPNKMLPLKVKLLRTIREEVEVRRGSNLGIKKCPAQFNSVKPNDMEIVKYVFLYINDNKTVAKKAASYFENTNVIFRSYPIKLADIDPMVLDVIKIPAVAVIPTKTLQTEVIMDENVDTPEQVRDYIVEFLNECNIKIVPKYF